MNRFDGTAARQLELIDPYLSPTPPRPVSERNRPVVRLLRRDVYAELDRRRRRAQIAARRWVDR